MNEMSSKYRFIGCVNDISQLYVSNNISIGDIYYVNDKQSLYVYNSGNEFIEISNNNVNEIL